MRIIKRFAAALVALCCCSAMCAAPALAAVDYPRTEYWSSADAAWTFLQQNGLSADVPDFDTNNQFVRSVANDTTGPFYRFCLNYVQLVPALNGYLSSWRVLQSVDIEGFEAKNAYEDLLGAAVDQIESDWAAWVEDYPGAGGGSSIPEGDYPSGDLTFSEAFPYYVPLGTNQLWPTGQTQNAKPVTYTATNISGASDGVVDYSYTTNAGTVDLKTSLGNGGVYLTRAWASGLQSYLSSGYDVVFSVGSSFSGSRFIAICPSGSWSYTTVSNGLVRGVTCSESFLTLSLDGLYVDPSGSYCALPYPGNSFQNASSHGAGSYGGNYGYLTWYGSISAGSTLPGVGPSDGPSGPSSPDYTSPEPYEPTSQQPGTIVNNVTNNTTTYTGSETDYSDYLRIIIDNQNEQIGQIFSFSEVFSDAYTAFSSWLMWQWNELFGYLSAFQDYFSTLLDWESSSNGFLFSLLEELRDFRRDANEMIGVANELLSQILAAIPSGSGGGDPSYPDVSVDPGDDAGGFFGWLLGLLSEIVDLLIGSVDDISGLADDVSELSGVFPFSIPWDLAAVIGLLVAEPVADYVIQWPILDGATSSGGVTWSLAPVDLSAFSDIFSFIRFGFLGLVAIGLAYKTKDALELLGKVVG